MYSRMYLIVWLFMLSFIAPQLVVSEASDQLSLSSSSSDLIMVGDHTHAQAHTITHPLSTRRAEPDQISLG